MRKKISEFEPNVAKEINDLIDRYHFVLLEFKDGYVYWLIHHHRYLHPEKEAPRVKVAKHIKPDRLHYKKENFMYLTSKV